jgi:hypothetical protein
MANEKKPATTDDGVEPVEIAPIYASTVQVQSTGHDLTLLFRRPRPATTAKRVAEGTQPDAAVLELVSVLILSPGTAKDLSLLLRHFVERHEKEYGTINTPYTKRLAQALAAAEKKQ